MQVIPRGRNLQIVNQGLSSVCLEIIRHLDILAQYVEDSKDFNHHSGRICVLLSSSRVEDDFSSLQEGNSVINITTFLLCNRINDLNTDLFIFMISRILNKKIIKEILYKMVRDPEGIIKFNKSLKFLYTKNKKVFKAAIKVVCRGLLNRYEMYYYVLYFVSH